jgi:hypothetical protein
MPHLYIKKFNESFLIVKSFMMNLDFKGYIERFFIVIKDTSILIYEYIDKLVKIKEI